MPSSNKGWKGNRDDLGRFLPNIPSPRKGILFEDERGENHPCWKGGKKVLKGGYIGIHCPSSQGGVPPQYRPEHVLIAERVLGKELPPGAIVHHVDENKTNNSKDNLVICENLGYHRFLHHRMKTLKACGHVNWKRCWVCGKYDALENLHHTASGLVPGYHRDCYNAYRRPQRRKGIGGVK